MQTLPKRPKTTTKIPTTFGPYVLGPLIIESQNSTAVYQGHHSRDESQQVAIKLMHKARLSLAQRRDVDREIAVLRRLQPHPGVVRLLYVHDDGDYVAMVMPLADADLFCYIDDSPELLDEDTVRAIFTSIVEAVAYCHDRGICHRDLKVENVLLYFDKPNAEADKRPAGNKRPAHPLARSDSDVATLPLADHSDDAFCLSCSPRRGAGKRKRSSQAVVPPSQLVPLRSSLSLSAPLPPPQSQRQPLLPSSPFHAPRVVLTDFGFAENYKPGSRLNKWCGTLLTAAPEILQQRPYAPEAADVWSLGSILYTLLSASFPFYSDDRAILVERTIRGPMHPLPKGISDCARHLVGLMLNRDPAQRLTLRQVLAHPFLRQDAVLNDDGPSSDKTNHADS